MKTSNKLTPVTPARFGLFSRTIALNKRRITTTGEVAMFVRTTLVSTLAAAGLLLAAPASASTVSVSGFADGSASSCSSSYDSCGVDFYYGYTTIDPSPNVNYGNVDTSGSTASPDSTHVYETGTGSATPYAISSSWTDAGIGIAHAYASVSATGAAPGTDGTEAQARAYSSWTDSITVTSLDLALGTPVDLYATLVSEGTVSAGGANINGAAYGNLDGPYGAGAGASFSASAGGPTTWYAICDNTAPGDTTDGSYCSKIVDIPTTVGATLNLSGDLQLQVYADFSAGDAVSATATANYANTSYVAITSNTAGVNFTSASGYGYQMPSPVPLPSSALLFGSGILVLATSRRRKQRKQ
jgi:hypothetical protein